MGALPHYALQQWPAARIRHLLPFHRDQLRVPCALKQRSCFSGALRPDPGILDIQLCIRSFVGHLRYWLNRMSLFQQLT